MPDMVRIGIHSHNASNCMDRVLGTRLKRKHPAYSVPFGSWPKCGIVELTAAQWDTIQAEHGRWRASLRRTRYAGELVNYWND